MTITTWVPIGGYLGVMLTDLDVERLPQTSIELSEPFLVLFVQEHSLDVSLVMQPLVQLVQEGGLNVAAFHLWCATVPIVQSHRQYGRCISVASCRVGHLCRRKHLK